MAGDFVWFCLVLFYFIWFWREWAWGRGEGGGVYIDVVGGAVVNADALGK